MLPITLAQGFWSVLLSLVAGYERERITPTELYQGGADWEYRYLDEGRPMQVMRILQVSSSL